MIANLLDRDFLLAVGEDVHDHLEKATAYRAAPRRRARGDSIELEDQALRGLAEVLRSELDRESDPSSAKDRIAFVPRSPVLSLLQSALDEHFETEATELVTEDRPLVGRRRAAATPVATSRRLRDVQMSRPLPGRRRFGRMEVTRPKIFSDPRWAWSALAMGWRALNGRAAFVDAPPTVEIANQARMVMLGDWGSGINRARDVAEQVKGILADGDARQTVVIHLGDVYYSGWRREYEQRFLEPWPVAAGSDALSFCLVGNHDMYGGGHAYYGTCLGDSRFARQEGCSFFELHNDYWQILGLDTAYEDAGLHGRQADWAAAKRAGNQRRTCLLSHHQLLSAHQEGAEVLRQKIGPVLTGGLDAWFWGHEHRCIEYGPSDFEGQCIAFASCVGHSGIPEYLVIDEGDTREPPWRYEYLKRYGNDSEPWNTFGFCVADLNDNRMSVRYIDEHGSCHHEVSDVAS